MPSRARERKKTLEITQEVVLTVCAMGVVSQCVVRCKSSDANTVQSKDHVSYTRVQLRTVNKVNATPDVREAWVHNSIKDLASPAAKQRGSPLFDALALSIA